MMEPPYLTVKIFRPQLTYSCVCANSGRLPALELNRLHRNRHFRSKMGVATAKVGVASNFSRALSAHSLYLNPLYTKLNPPLCSCNSCSMMILFVYFLVLPSLLLSTIYFYTCSIRMGPPTCCGIQSGMGLKPPVAGVGTACIMVTTPCYTPTFNYVFATNKNTCQYYYYYELIRTFILVEQC